MKYYENKSKAYQLIIEELKKNTPKPVILHKLMINFGFGMLFLNKTLEEIGELNQEFEEKPKKEGKK